MEKVNCHHCRTDKVMEDKFSSEPCGESEVNCCPGGGGGVRGLAGDEGHGGVYSSGPQGFLHQNIISLLDSQQLSLSPMEAEEEEEDEGFSQHAAYIFTFSTILVFDILLKMSVIKSVKFVFVFCSCF